MKPYVFVDLETTGLDYKEDQIIEIGAIKTDTRLNQLDEFHTMVSLNEGKSLPESITDLTGIEEHMLVGSPSESEALSDLENWIGESVVVAHNAPFDLSFLSRGDITPENFICTRNLVNMVEPDMSASLKKVCERNEITLEGHHRALNDVHALISLFDRYVPIVENLGMVYTNLVMDSPDRPLNYTPPNAVVRRVVNLAIDIEVLNHYSKLLYNSSSIKHVIQSVIERSRDLQDEK